MSRNLGEPFWEIWVLNALGHAAVLKQDWMSGLGYYQQAVDQSRTSHDVLSEVMSRINLAEVARTVGDTPIGRNILQIGCLNESK
jgi:hypothetical protein